MITMQISYNHTDTRDSWSLSDSSGAPGLTQVTGIESTAAMRRRAAEYTAAGRRVRLCMLNVDYTDRWLGAWGLKNPEATR